jgi:hypothetical protein
VRSDLRPIAVILIWRWRARRSLRSPATKVTDPSTALEDCRKLCRCRVRLPALYFALGLKPIVKIVTVSPSSLLVKFVSALLNLLLNRDQGGRLVGLCCGCQWLFLDLVWMASYLFPQLFSLPFQFVGFGAFLCHAYSLTQT